ncbi:MAG TPA: zf-HC2 domain-containing protein [Methylomirabilota bacterium]|jgi:predicted anti-sigma-YlaC factor YlaD
MNCHEILPLIPPVIRGETSLTDWALVEAHLKQCSGCRAERERLVHERQSLLNPVWSQTLTDLSDGLAERTRHTAADLTALPARLGDRLRTPVTEAVAAAGHAAGAARGWAEATATGTRAAAREITARSAALGERAARGATRLRAGSHAVAAGIGRAGRSLRSGLASATAQLRRGVLDGVARGRVHVGRVASHARSRTGRAAAASTATLHSFLRVKSVQVAGIALLVGLGLYVLLPSPILRPDAPPDVAIARRPPARPEPTDGGSRRGSEPAPARLATARSGAKVATTSAQSPRSGGPHVVGRLTVRDRGASEQELTELLARSGGARIGGRSEVSASTVYAVIPSSRYHKFVHGLAQIGSWQVEAERSPLPRGVRMAIRVDD